MFFYIVVQHLIRAFEIQSLHKFKMWYSHYYSALLCAYIPCNIDIALHSLMIASCLSLAHFHRLKCCIWLTLSVPNVIIWNMGHV